MKVVKCNICDRKASKIELGKYYEYVCPSGYCYHLGIEHNFITPKWGKWTLFPLSILFPTEICINCKLVVDGIYSKEHRIAYLKRTELL